MLTRIVKYLSSLRFTIVLIALLGVMFAIGLWVPQQGLLKNIYLEWQRKSPELVGFLDTLGLTTIYTSPLTITLWILFFLNLTLVLWQRIPVVRHRIALSEAKIADPASAPGYPFKESYLLPAGLGGEAPVDLLRKRGYAVLGDFRGFYAVKNRLSPIAFMLFHVSFFLILLGGLVTMYTEFAAYINLSEGETFTGNPSRYNQVPAPSLPKIGSLPSTSFTITRIVPQVVHNTPTGVSVHLVDSRGKGHVIGINRPYVADHTSFVFKHLGMAPLFILKTSPSDSGEKISVKLDVLKMKPDTFSTNGYTFTATFYPDFVMDNGKRASRSMEFNNPVFFITVEKDGKKIAEGLVPQGGSLEFAGSRLELRELHYWTRLYVDRQRGLSILYAGFAIACIAVIWRMIFYKREILGAVTEKDGERLLTVAGRSEYYKSLAEDEFAKLFGTITGARVE